jgi:hypothetical protein
MLSGEATNTNFKVFGLRNLIPLLYPSNELEIKDTTYIAFSV